MKRHLTESEIRKISNMLQEARILLDETTFKNIEEQKNFEYRLLVIESCIKNAQKVRAQKIGRTNKGLDDRFIGIVTRMKSQQLA